MLYLGKGIQKYAIEKFKEEGEVKKIIKSPHAGTWIVGTILTTIYMFVQWAALLFAPINLIAPLEGIGLVTLMIFSFYILKEEITNIEIVGIAAIITGTVLITLFNTNTGLLIAANFNQNLSVTFILSILVIVAILVITCHFSGYKAAGLLIGGAAGSCMAIQTFTKRITAIPDIYWLTELGYIALVLIFGLLTLLITQYAFAKAKANQVVPVFTSLSMILATIMGIFALSERIEMMQILGIAIIVAGVILLTAFRKEDESAKQ